MRVHILRPESITPLERYVAWRRAAPTDHLRQRDFAAILLQAEREHETLHPAWRDAPVELSPPAPYDIFGLKAEAIDGLSAVTKRVKAHAFAWLMLERLYADMLRVDDAGDAAQVARTLGEKDGDVGDRIRRLAWRVRTREEGEAFTKYLRTEREFCEDERDAAMRGFDDARVPRELQALIPYARRVGVGDDVCRARFVREMSRDERRALAQAVRASADGIDRWIAASGEPPYGTEVSAFFWLRHLAEEIG